LLEGKKKWMVQVSLAANQANADATVSKLRAKGYKVVTSPTSKGIRVMVGPAKDRETADTARRKIQADSSLGMKSAWIIDWHHSISVNFIGLDAPVADASSQYF
jgi:fructose-specific component phosphotransferase system IIB-like protein